MSGEVSCQGKNAMAAIASPTMLVNRTADETIHELTRIWQDLFAIPSIAADQNYFDLGGDSPLAVQLFARIEKTFNVRLPLATLFEAPTIEGLAQILRREVPASGWSPLVAIRTEGQRPPFFCIHPHGGNVLAYRDLSLHLGDDQPFYGLQSCGLDGSSPPLTRIEDMAALYMKAIQKVQPHGPYFLGGYCMGGVVAYEMAQRFVAAGEQVALLALFDALNWGGTALPSVWEKCVHTAERLMFHMANFFSLNARDKNEFFRQKVKALRSRAPVWWSMLQGNLLRNSNSDMSEAQILDMIWKVNLRACLEYIPKPYAGAVIDMRPAKQFRSYNKPDLKWDRLAQGGQKVIVLPVNPPAMLVEPFVRHLAVALRESIDRAIESL
jgi:thioesterase domain-containing protein/acyl carrier protein